MDNYENCKNNFEKLFNWYLQKKDNRNEATTRFHLIDELILNCLGWEREAIITEDNYENTFTDYTFKNSRSVLILEAKKEGDYFQIPVGKTNLIYSIKTLCKDNPNFKKAIQQVSNYCQNRGIQFGAICNGWQIVIFVANRIDGIPPLDGKAYVFPSLEIMQKNFIDLWNILSKPGIENKNIIKKLIGDLLPELPPKLSSSITNYPGIKNRNPFQTDMQIISEIVLEDVIRHRDLEKLFLEECYCKSGALSQYAQISKKILKSRYEYLFERKNQKVTISTAHNKKGISSDMAEVVAYSLSRRPILLIGDVGVGKTSFIDNLINVEAETVFKNSITFKINLGSQAIISQDIKKTIINVIVHPPF